ncbi:glycerophosphodiester phosphodiesterase family protein [Vibrio lentus]|nr:glycerophosphodiester phosphodiesterase family protein [Vibrio lentus]
MAGTHPENTKVSIEQAGESWVEVVEVDIQVTLDDQLVALVTITTRNAVVMVKVVLMNIPWQSCAQQILAAGNQEQFTGEKILTPH